MNVALVVGCARSGTSILGELVAAHPEVDYVFENHGLWEPSEVGDEGSHRLTAADATPEAIERIRGWFEERANGSVLVEKNPRNVLRVPFIRAVLPEAKIVHIVRDGRDVACSMMPAVGGERWAHLKPPGWQALMEGERGLVRCALAWQAAIEIALDDLRGVDHRMVRYEDLVHDPRRVAAELLRYLALPADRNVEDFCSRIQDSTHGSYHADRQRKWFSEEHSRRVGRWREWRESDPGELARVEAVLRPTLERLGYV